MAAKIYIPTGVDVAVFLGTLVCGFYSCFAAVVVFPRKQNC